MTQSQLHVSILPAGDVFIFSFFPASITLIWLISSIDSPHIRQVPRKPYNLAGKKVFQERSRRLLLFRQSAKKKLVVVSNSSLRCPFSSYRGKCSSHSLINSRRTIPVQSLSPQATSCLGSVACWPLQGCSCKTILPYHFNPLIAGRFRKEQHRLPKKLLTWTLFLAGPQSQWLQPRSTWRARQATTSGRREKLPTWRASLMSPLGKATS